MRKRRLIRFSLAQLVLVTTAVAVFLGYAQWRRHSILREARSLEADGFALLWQDTWADWIWPVVPKQAAIEYYKLPDDQWRIASRVYTEDAFNSFVQQTCDRLRMLGVEEIRCDFAGKVGDSYISTTYGRAAPNDEQKRELEP